MEDVISVSLGVAHTMAVTSDGTLWTWGCNLFGAIGDGTIGESENRGSPFKAMNDVVYISAGKDYSMAITSDGVLWAWGNNERGQLGDGTLDNRAVPTKIMEDVIAVSAGTHHTAAITSDRTLWTWGDGAVGQLGLGNRSSFRTPQRVMGDVTAVSVQASYDSARTMAITSDGTLWAWGASRLGDGTATRRTAPIRIMEDVVYISAGVRHIFAITADGNLWGWGNNTHGQLGFEPDVNDDSESWRTSWRTPQLVWEFVG